jgi:hypothetical protein
MLAERMGRHGVTLSGAALGTLLAEQAGAATVSAPLVDSTVQAAALVAAGQASAGLVSAEAFALSEEVVRTMFLGKLKMAAVLVLTFAVLAGGASYLTVQALADKPVAADAPKPEKKPAPADAVKKKEPAPETAAAEKKPQSASVQGVITALDATKGAVTIRVPANDGTKNTKEETFTIGKDVKVLLADVLTKGDTMPEGKLADLSEGTTVALQLSDDKKTVTGVTARGPTIQAKVQSVDAARNTITVNAPKGAKKEIEQKVLELVNGAKVLLNDGKGSKKDDASKDQEGKLGDLAEGTPVYVQLTVDQKRALGIRVQSITLTGTLVGHDAGNNTITISTKGDGDKTYTVAKDATLVDLVVGTRVSLRFSVFEKDKVIAAHGQKE